MSTITYLTSLVQQAIGRLNNYEANAKKVDELPHQTTLEPSSKIPVSRAGISEHLTVQQIISSIQNSNYNQLLAIGTISVSGTDITVPSGVSGQINGLLYGTSADTILSITLCPTGFSRKDIIVLTTANTVVVISGEETDGAIVLAPPVPTDALYITEFDVNDTTIGAPIDPSLGTQFKQKNENQKFNPTLGGTTAVITIQPFGQNYYSVGGPVTGIVGFSKTLITASPTAEVPYAGKDFYIENKTDHNVTLKNAFTPVDIPFNLGADLVVPTNGIVWLKYNPNTEKMDLFFKSWSEVDLSTKADLVGGKVPASQLPAYVDDVVEGYFNGTNFYTDAGFTILITGETGKIYLALDTNSTYRWSGSAYVQIGGAKRVAICDLGRFYIKVPSINTFVIGGGFPYYNPNTSTNITNHLLLIPSNQSIIYKVPFDCSLIELSISVSTLSDSNISIWKTAPNQQALNPIELFYVEDSSGNVGMVNFEINSGTILKDSYIHIFYARRLYTSNWVSGAFLRFKEI